MKGRDLRQYIPLLPFGSPDDSCVISKRGDITFGWQLTLPVAHTVSPAGYDSIILDFLRAYKSLPEYCIVHKQDIYKYEIYQRKVESDWLTQAYEDANDGRKNLNGYCYLFLTFSNKANIESSTEYSGFFKSFNSKPPTGALINQCASYAATFASILGKNPLIRMRELCASDFIHAGEHGEDRGILPAYLSLYHDNRTIDYAIENFENHVQYDDKQLKAWYVEDSDSYPEMLSSVVEVGEMSTVSSKVYLSGGSPLGFSLRIPHIVNRYVITLPAKQVEDELNQKQRLNNSFSRVSQRCRINARDLDAYLESAADGSQTTIKCFMDIMAWGREEEFGEIYKQLNAAASNLDLQLSEEVEHCGALYYAGIPGAESNLGSDYFMTSEVNAYLTHGLWDGYDNGFPEGVIRCKDRSRLMPVRVDFQRVAYKMGLGTNSNAFVVGPSGSGKSYLMNHFAHQFYVDGQYVLIIDVGDSYEGLTRYVNEVSGGKAGRYYSYDPKHPLRFNPFLGRKSWDDKNEDGELDSGGIEFIMSILMTIAEGSRDGAWKTAEEACLLDILLLFFNYWDNGADPESPMGESLLQIFLNEAKVEKEKNGEKFTNKDMMAAKIAYVNPLCDLFSEEKRRREPIFNDFYLFCARVVSPLINNDVFKVGETKIDKSMFNINEFVESIKLFSLEGLYGFLLNAEEQVDYFEVPFSVFEVDKIMKNEKLFPIWMLSILHLFEQKMRTLDCEKVMIIEEAWSAIAKPTTAKFITWLWRTARKFSTSAVCVSQSIADLDKSDIIGDAIIENSQVKIFLDQSSNASKFREVAGKKIAMSDMKIAQVLSVNSNLDPRYNYKEFFIMIGDHFSEVYALELSKKQAGCFESKKSIKKPILEYADEHTYIEALEHFYGD